MPGDVVRSLSDRNDGNVRGLSLHAQREIWTRAVAASAALLP